MGSGKATYRKEGLNSGSQLKGSVNQGPEGKVQGYGAALLGYNQTQASGGAECWCSVLLSFAQSGT